MIKENSIFSVHTVVIIGILGLADFKSAFFSRVGNERFLEFSLFCADRRLLITTASYPITF